MSKFKRSIAHLVAVAAIAGALGGASAAPAVAAGCNWHIPSSFVVYQSNNWQVHTGYLNSNYQATAYGFVNGYVASPAAMGTLTLTRFDTSGTRPQVEFTITWSNGSAGIYRGTIDGYGFISGISTDRWNGYQASFRVRDAAYCG